MNLLNFAHEQGGQVTIARGGPAGISQLCEMTCDKNVHYSRGWPGFRSGTKKNGRTFLWKGAGDGMMASFAREWRGFCQGSSDFTGF